MHPESRRRRRECPGSRALLALRRWNTAGMIEGQQTLAEAFTGGYIETAPAEMLLPETQRFRGYRQADGADLPAAFARLTPGVAHREAGDQSAYVAGIVAVVQVQDGLVAIVERRLFHALESQDLRVKVIVFLRPSDAERQMMVTVDVCIHAHGQSPWPARVTSVVTDPRVSCKDRDNGGSCRV